MDSKDVGAVAEEIKRKVSDGVSLAEDKANKEIAKVKKVTAAAIKQAEQFVKKNPEKATMVAAGIGVALAAAAAMLFRAKAGKKKK